MLMPLPKIFMVVSILFMLMIDSAPLVYYLTVGRFLALGQYLYKYYYNSILADFIKYSPQVYNSCTTAGGFSQPWCATTTNSYYINSRYFA